MHFLTQLLLLVGIFAVGWWIYRIIKGNPSAFSRENLGKSFFTMGVLAIILIAFITFCIFLLRHGM